MAIAEAGGRFARPVQIILLVLLLAKPLWVDAQSLIYERNPDDIKPAIHYAQAHQQPGDGWYVYHFARYQFWYYSEIYQMRQRTVRIGADCGTERVLPEDLDQLRGQARVWILFSHIRAGRTVRRKCLLDHSIIWSDWMLTSIEPGRTLRLESACERYTCEELTTDLNSYRSAVNNASFSAGGRSSSRFCLPSCRIASDQPPVPT
jgi:hypothetical protein